MNNANSSDNDGSFSCALALAVLGRGRSDYSDETRIDYARKCAEAESNA